MTDRGRAAPLFVFAAAFALFTPTASFEFLIIDDPRYVTANGRVLAGLNAEGVRWAFTTFHAANYHPLTWLSHMLDVTLFGPSPGPAHLVNAIVHASNAALFTWLLQRGCGGGAMRAVFAGLLFSLHPLRVESVAWISERKDVLATLFALLCLAAYGAWVKRRRPGLLSLAHALFALSLLSKPSWVTLPFALLLVDEWPLRREEPWRARLAEKSGFLLLACAASAVTLWAQRSGGAVRSLADVTVLERAANVVAGYAGYLSKTVVPFPLAFFYPLERPGAAVAVFGGAALGATVVIALGNLRRAPAFAVGWLWFLGTLVPMIGIVQVGGAAIADRYTYVPHLGLAAALAYAVPPFAPLKTARRALGAAGLVVVVLLALATSRQLPTWRSSEALYRHAADVTSPNAVAEVGLSQLRSLEGRGEEAVRHAQAALRIVPDDPAARAAYGLAEVTAGRPERALDSLLFAARKGELSPAAKQAFLTALLRFPESARKLAASETATAVPAVAHGLIAARSGDHGAARRAFERAATIDAAWPDVQFNLGVALAQTGQLQEAKAALSRALALDPNHAGALHTLKLVEEDLARRTTRP